MRKDGTKIYGIRTEASFIEDYNNACKDLPIALKPSQLITSYMQYIIDTSNYYKKTGQVKMGFLSFEKNLVLLNLEGRQTHFKFDED